MSTTHRTEHDRERERAGRWGRAAVWLPGLAVALGAAVATAHGLFEVAAAAGVPAGIAWIYPLITDGLALVAYAATARLHGSAARYAWAVVIVSAGLSGLAQASYLASATDTAAGLVAGPGLRFGVGAWPAIAAAIAAHLLYLLAADSPATPTGGRDRSERTGVQGSTLADVQRSAGPVQPEPAAPTPAALPNPDNQPRALPSGADEPSGPGPVEPTPRSDRPTARERARDAARAYRARNRDWPTVTELQDAADVSRGTASAALRDARDAAAAPAPLHLIPQRTDTDPSESDQP